ncbi:hypothetical protein TNCV_3453151 [Trichonephila clavipes]|nr:hypothetical protein TNCV_3453151 [Trichonephila clavipes]
MLVFTQQGFRSTDSTTFPPFPDLLYTKIYSLVEHTCGHLGQQVGQLMSLVDLVEYILPLDNEILQDTIRHLYASIPDHATSYIHARGGPKKSTKTSIQLECFLQYRVIYHFVLVLYSLTYLRM